MGHRPVDNNAKHIGIVCRKPRKTKEQYRQKDKPEFKIHTYVQEPGNFQLDGLLRS